MCDYLLFFHGPNFVCVQWCVLKYSFSVVRVDVSLLCVCVPNYF